jgi:hypothetical protein
MSRERFWGVYDWNDRAWVLDAFGKRWRFLNAIYAKEFITEFGWSRGYSPRPFYVVRKAKKITKRWLTRITTCGGFEGFLDEGIARDLSKFAGHSAELIVRIK